MRIVFAWHDTSAYPFDDEKGYDQPDYEEDTRIDDYTQEAAIVFWRMAVSGGIVRFAHAE